MKLLLDTCVWGKAAVELRLAGHDVIWAGDWPNDPGDESILALAHAEYRVLITLDKDFGELVIVRGASHSGIIRLVGISARTQATVAAQILQSHAEELIKGSVITVSPGRLRIRAPD